MNETIPYFPGLSPVEGKELCARFDGGRLSSDGGVLLFPGIERRLGIADLLASCVTDERTPASTTHTYADMIRARARILKHVIRRIRRHWPRVEITVRGDGHYGTPDVMELLEDQGCNYIFGLPGNARLSKTGQPWCEDVAVRRVQRGKDKLRRFFRVAYRAKSWSRERKVVARVEATSKGCDVRFVVTNLPARAKVLYEKVYCARGRMENMIKDHKLYTKSDQHPATAGRPTSSACSCTPAPTGYCTNFARPRPAARCGARRRSKPSAAPSSRSPCASRSSNPASGSPCRQPIHIGRLSCRWPVGYKPKDPEPSGRCRRINPNINPQHL